MNCDELAEIVESLDAGITIRRFTATGEYPASLLLINGDEALFLHPAEEGVRLEIPGYRWKSRRLEKSEFLSQVEDWIAHPPRAPAEHKRFMDRLSS